MTLHPAPLLMIGGAAVVLAGVGRQGGELRRPARDLRKALALTRSLRTSLVGLAMIGVGAGWLLEIAPLLVVSLVIGGEELLETSVVAAALDAELRRRSGAAVS